MMVATSRRKAQRVVWVGNLKVRRRPAWKCPPLPPYWLTSRLTNPPLGNLKVRRGPAGNASCEWKASHIQTH